MVPRRAADDGCRALSHARRTGDRGFDVFEFESLTVEFHLEVGAAEVLDLPGRRPAREVAGAVHPGPRGERVRHESGRGQFRCGRVSARELITGHVQLAADAGQRRAQTRIEDEHTGAGSGRTDRDDVRGFAVRACRRVDRGLGETVLVDDRRAGQICQCAVEQSWGEALTAGEHGSQGGDVSTAVLEEHGEDRRDELDRCGGRLLDEAPQVAGVAMALWSGDHCGRAGGERPEQFPHGRVERERRLDEDSLVGGVAESAAEPGEECPQRAMGDGDALRHAR
ncbi:hypothetical protein GM1_002_01520 [Gordonia malaquae NBRC 108250]|uniref:Uncharacterized protein n=1 Tax=Gordonia malaquae NBRC 108250 TaxID=1223542 RepID=M3VD54_GORML|nr:hypothetical protein GM1_002_01520 [Gordonia malaquae NBRC 108250]